MDSAATVAQDARMNEKTRTDSPADDSEALPLLERFNAIVRRARKLGPDPWDRSGADSLCSDAQDLADEALASGQDDLGEALLGYAVYLSSFVEGALVPNAEQLAQLAALTDTLHEAGERMQSRMPVADLLQAPSVFAPLGTVVWAIGLDPESTQKLAVGLARMGHDLGRVNRVGYLRVPLAEGRVLAAAVARSALAEWQALLDEPTAGKSSQPRPPTLCIGEDSRMPYRLQALRAGAEGYYTSGTDDLTLARRMVDLIEDRTAPYRVLIVDDDASITMFCEAVLRHNGMQPKVVNNPMSLFEALEDFDPDVILVDLYMPEVNGLELLALLRSHPGTLFTPVILLSGDDDVERRFDALHLGGDDYLTKPIRPRFLVAAVTSRARRARWIRRELDERLAVG
jgi:CheY-like chemotaxis protein